jgi:hypothetical protein
VTARSSRTVVKIRPSLILAFALPSLFSLTACVSNKSADPRLSSVMHQCFRTTDDAVLYETPFCPPQSGVNTRSACVTVKYLNSFRPPVTLREFNTSGRADEEVMHELRRSAEGQDLFAPSPDKIHVLGVLIWGTSFTIQSVHRYSNYTDGAIWITTAQILDGEFAGHFITLPWENLMQQFPGDGGWITDFVQREPFVRDPYTPQINSKKMVPCEAPATPH